MIDNDVFYENKCGNNFEYILKDNADFSDTDYKVLLNQNNGLFIKCAKMTRNGLIDLFYLTDERNPLSSLLDISDNDTLINLFVSLFADVIEIKNNGFLSCQSLDLSWDKVFVEKNTQRVELVYLPFKKKAFGSYLEFETNLRSRVYELLKGKQSNPDNRLSRFLSDLSNDTLSLEEVYDNSKLVDLPVANDLSHYSSQKSNMVRGLKLVAINSPEPFELIIDSNEVVIGKKQELVDKVIPYNKMISRKHCKIISSNGTHYISDEGSANGTYVNGTRLENGQSLPIKQGDIIRLANSDFRVV